MTSLRRSKYGTVADHPALAPQFDVERNGRAPDQVPAGTGERLWWCCPVAGDHRWRAAGSVRLRGTGCPACAGQQVSVTNNLARFPELAVQFDVAANGGRTPDQVIAGTTKRLWWSCAVAPDHRWAATGGDRLRGSGCPACAGRQASVTNSLANHPELAAQFDVAANGGLTPAEVPGGTTKKLWWACSVAPDHRWRASGAARLRGNGCPACAGRQVSVTNNLARFPELAAQFDVAANGGLTPDQVVATTQKRLWWSCPVAEDHRWAARGNDRVKGGGCPSCAGRQVSVTNSLARFPELAAQFDVERNGCTPAEVIAGSNQKWWWACPVSSDHRWRSTANNRLNGRGCPACAGRQVSVTNSLARHPQLAEQFDVAANGGRTPDQIPAGSHERLWWFCLVADDHRWRVSPADRINHGTGCPACAGLQVSATNSLANHPELAAQFDVEANGGRTPDQIVAGTGEKLWWFCPVGPDHRWRTSSVNRLRNGTGCPVCVLAYTSAREIRLATELAAVLPGLDLDDHRLSLPERRALHVDVLDRVRRLAVEYDGAYWHAEESKVLRDRIKTARLVEAGYTVIRVREAPLEPITAADVSIRPTEPIHAVTAAVLDRLAELRPDLLSAAEAAAYRLGGRELASAAAEARLADLRSARVLPLGRRPRLRALPATVASRPDTSRTAPGLRDNHRAFAAARRPTVGPAAPTSTTTG